MKPKEYRFEEKGFISEDEQRASDYKEVKKIIDRYHKDFIESALGYLTLSDLQEFSDLYFKQQKDEKEKKLFTSLQTKLRKQVADAFNKSSDENIVARFKNIDKKELIKDDLITWLSDEKDKELVGKFKNFTTYFGGFHKNRENMYSADDKSTAISYRLIHENLPKYLDNIKAFEKISQAELTFDNIAQELESVIQGVPIESFFTIEYFNQCLTQNGITIYNTLLGGISEEGKDKIQGLNEHINLYNQQLKGDDKKTKKLPKLTLLFKQILSDRVGASFVLDEIEDDTELLEGIQNFYTDELLEFETDGKQVSIFKLVKYITTELQNSDLTKVYIKNDASLTEISNKIYGDWSIIKNALAEYYDKNLLPAKLSTKALDEKDKWLKSNLSIETIQTALQEYDNKVKNNRELENPILWYFQKLGADDGNNNLLDAVVEKYNAVEPLLKTAYPTDKKLAADKKAKQQIKEFLDSLMDVIHFIKPFDAVAGNADKDLHFYGIFDAVYNQLNQTISLYNKVRNYLTKKPYSTEKFKLNFENSTLLDGWDKNKEKDNCSVLFRKDGLFYLGVMDKKHNKIFEDYVDTNSDENFEKIVYKMLPGPNKMLPKVFFSNSRIDEFNPSSELLENYKLETHKKGDSFNIKDCHNLIDFFKSSINKHPDWKQFNFNFSDTNSYEDLSYFYKEVSHQGYKITYENISDNYINQLVNEGKLYLFQIYNKDFSPQSKGTPNLHTIYWKMLFDERNLSNVVYKLNGEAEIFFRKQSLKRENTAIHHANEKINRRTDGETESIFPYEIVKNKRFTVDKFQFHVPITMNFKGAGNERLNNDVLQFLQNNPDVNIIGLDRGERHLIYLTLINQKGEILEQKTLNTVSSSYISNGERKEHTVDYHEKLDAVEKDRTKSRKEWDAIENIKELKSGYLSQVVHEIATMMVDNNAIIVMEDLNFGFKKGRIKVEKQVYQKFEKALIDKLNYLVFKKNDAQEAGGALKAYQLTNKFAAFKDLGKQCGFIFYVSADYTSKIDPATGFVNLLYPKYESVEKSQKFFSNFDKVCYNKQQDYFEFHIDYKKFTTRADETKTKWTICSNSERLVNFRNPENNSEWDTKKVYLTDELKELFAGIDFENGNCIKDEIVSKSDSKFFKDLIYILKLTLQMRNSKTGTDIDYLISPVEENGKFFDSRYVDNKLPKDADANGAFNTARKGILLLHKISKADDVTKLKFNDLKIDNKEWLAFVQNKQ